MTSFARSCVPARRASAPNAAPSSTQRAVAISRYGYKAPVMSDMVEDNVRSRFLGVFAIVAVYCVLALTIVSLFRPNVVVPAEIAGISRPVGTSTFRTAQAALRAPSFRLIGEQGARFGGANFTLSIESFTQDVTYGALPCATSTLRDPSFAGTLDLERFQTACEGIFSGVEVTADDEGVASFDNLALVRGPPGIYRFRVNATARVKNGVRFTHLERNMEEAMKFSSNVRRVYIETPAPASANARTSINPQPVLRVTDIMGEGIEDVTCVAFTTEEPSEAGKLAELDVLRSVEPNVYALPGSSTRTRLQRAHNIGQRFATLSGEVSSKSDSAGQVRFSNLTLETSSTPEAFICFYCEGSIACWSDPSSSSSVDLPKSARYTPPIAVTSTVAGIQTVNAANIEIEVVEGFPLSSPLRVKIVDASGNGVPGARAVAILGKSDDATPPIRYVRRGSKKLVNALSSVADGDGVAVFSNLAFTVPGPTRQSSGGFQIVVCSEGVCDSSISVAVKTSVQNVEIISSQTFLRYNGTNSDDESVLATLVGETEAEAATMPSLIRMLNANATGISGKSVTVKAIRLASQSYTGTYAVPDVGAEFNALHLGLTVATADVVSGSDGFLSVDIRFTHVTEDILAVADAGAIGLVFTVDGVDSNPTLPVNFAKRTARLLSEASTEANKRMCSKLVILEDPPQEVIRGKPFGWTSSDAADGSTYVPRSPKVKAVDSLGAPVENLLVALVSVEEFETRAPELFLPNNLDFTITDADGESTRQFTDWFDISSGAIYDTISDSSFESNRTSKYNERIFKKFSPRSDVIEAGPAGTARMMYVALIPDTTAGADAYTRATYWSAYETNHTAVTGLLDSSFGSDDPAMISAPDYYFYRATSPHSTFGCDVDGCKIACISDKFDIDVISPVSEIQFVDSRVANDVLDGDVVEVGTRDMRLDPISAYSVAVRDCIDTNILSSMGFETYIDTVIEKCHSTPYYPFQGDDYDNDYDYDFSSQYMSCLNTSSANQWMQDAGEQCGNFLGQASLTVKDSTGSPIRGERVDVALLHHPPTTYAFAAEKDSIRSCPSAQYPDCYFDYVNHVMMWDLPDSSTNAFASGLTKQFTVFCGVDVDGTCSKPIVIVTQPIQGTDSGGFTDVQFLFMPGNPGEYTFSFGSGVISSPPLTVYVTNSLANIELVDEPTTVNASVEFRVGEHLPVPDVRLSAADGTTRLGGFRPVLKFVDEDGSDASVLVDLGQHPYDLILGWNYFSHADLTTGIAELNAGWIVDGFDGCYAAQVEFSPCGYDDDDACAASKAYLRSPAASMFAPVRSPATTYKYCFNTSGITYEVLSRFGDSTAPGVPLAPGFSVKVKTDYRNEDFEDLGLMFAWIAPYDLKQSKEFRASRRDGMDDDDDDGVISPEHYRAHASGMFAGHLCVWSGFSTVHGPCGKSTFEKMGSTVTGNAMEYSYQATFDMFTWNQGNNKESFRPVALRARDYFFPNQTGVSTDSSITDGGDSFLVSRSVGMSSKPTTIVIATQPPKTIAVGDVFVVTVKATLSTGAAAPYVPITANVTSGGGISLQSASKFLDSYFGPQLAKGATDGDSPELDDDRAQMITDGNGFAVFKLRIRSGIPGNYSIYFSAGSTKSRKTSPFKLGNAVYSVTVNAFPTHALKVAAEDLPKTLYFDDTDVEITVNDASGAPITPSIVQAMVFRASTFAVVSGWESRNMTEEMLRVAKGDVESSEKLKTIYSLIVEGSRRLGDGSSQVNSGGTFEYDGPPVHVGSGKYRFSNPRLVVSKAGTHRTQFLVQGIASSSSHALSDTTVKLYSKSELAKIRWANNAAILSMIVLMFLGNMALRKRAVLIFTIVGGVGAIALLPFIAHSQSDAWAGVMYFTVCAIVIIAVTTFTHVMSDPAESATHVTIREASMMAYVRTLLLDPERAQRGALDENNRAWFHVVSVLRDVMSSVRGGTSRDAFFFPQRVLGTLVVSNVVIPVLMVGFVNAGKRLSERLLNLADKTAKTAFTFPRVIEDGYALSSAETGFIRGTDETWVYEQVRSAIRVFADLARAVEISSTIGAVVSYLLFVVTSLLFLANFRATMIRARQGKFVEELNRHKVKIETASEYTGTHVSVTIVNYYFSCAVFTLLLFPLCSENLWEYIAYFISANYGWILSTMLPVALNLAAKKFFVGKVLLDKKNKTIRNRTLWSFWELYNLFIGLLAGLAKGVGRFFVTVAFAFMAVARVDKLSLPTWLNALVPVDAVHQVYNAMFYMHHSHNAPAFRVAAWLFQECGDTHRSRVETKSESGLLTPAGARARTRFEIALLLHANPKLRDHRKHALSEGKAGEKDDTNAPDEPKESSEDGSKNKKPDEASPA